MKTKKERPVAFQRYQSELLTLNSLGERSDTSSGFDFDFCEGAMHSRTQRNTKETQRKTKEMLVSDEDELFSYLIYRFMQMYLRVQRDTVAKALQFNFQVHTTNFGVAWPGRLKNLGLVTLTLDS